LPLGGDIMENIDSIFMTLEKVIKENLIPIGYFLSREQYCTEIFGSKFVDFQNEDQVFQLIWDGKDGCFLLQYCNDILKYPFQDWKKIVVQPFDLNQSGRKNIEVIGIIENSFKKFLSELNKK
jgi:hypothetical protein